MVFNDLLQRKLTSILRPWLAQEPQLELKLGFFQSIVVAKNLNFDTSALNNLIDDDNQDLRWLFRSVTVDEVIIRVAHWRFPAFTLEFSGVNVTLFLEKRFVRKVDVSVDDYLDARKKKILAKIDSVEYHYFLILVGYSEHGVKMPKGCNLPRPAVQQWKMISQIIEKELPTEAIASARRVARRRAALEEPHAEDIDVSLMSSDPSSFQKIILWLALTWQAAMNLFAIIMSVFLLPKKSTKVDELRTISEVDDPMSCFQLRSHCRFIRIMICSDGSFFSHFKIGFWKQ